MLLRQRPPLAGLLTEWAVMRSADGLVLNYYGPSQFSVLSPGGRKVRLSEETAYPAGDSVAVTVSIPAPERFALRLRIPSWSSRTRVALNGESVNGVTAGQYLVLSREWKDGDTVVIGLDMSPHYWAGERELDGKASLYRGPILLAFDPAYNSGATGALPELDAARLVLNPAIAQKSVQPWIF